MMLQTSSGKLREKVLAENPEYDAVLKLGIAKEQSEKGAALLERAAGGSRTSESSVNEEVRRLQVQNKKLRKENKENKQPEERSTNKTPCYRCAKPDCPKGKKCKGNN